MKKASSDQLTVMMSSSIRGKQPLLEQIFAVLSTFGYKVWSSHKGSLPVRFGLSAYDTCLMAVEKCDIFFGLISPEYGSGTDGEGGKAITQLELERAIELGKPRFLLAHEQVIAARRLLLDLSFDGVKLGSPEARSRLKLRKGAQIVTDLRVIDMYEAGTMESLPIAERHDNWVQEYRSDEQALLYVSEQFGRVDDMREFVRQGRSKEGKAS